MRGHSRKIVVISCYIPPNYLTNRGKTCLEYISNTVIEVKRRYTDPYLVVMGDYNQWDVAEALGDFPEMAEAHDLPTRGGKSIDRIFTNFGNNVGDVRTLPPCLLYTSPSPRD